MNKIAFTTLILLISSASAFAEEPRYTGGMKYTTLSAGEGQGPERKPIYNRKPTEEESEESEATENEEPKTPEQSAWEKYKELAAGKGKASDTKEGTALPKAPEKPVPPEQHAAKGEPEQATGMTGLIQEYQRNKAKRSQIRSISFDPPEGLEIEAPEIETPEVEKPKVEKPETEN